MAKVKHILYDGIKSVSAWDLDSDVGWNVLTENGNAERIFYKRVAWLYRGANDRAQNVGSVPWAIMQGENEIASSTNLDTKTIPFTKQIRALLPKIELSLIMTGRAYVVMETNPSGYVKNLAYCSPYSIAPYYRDDGAVDYYQRTVTTPGRGSKIVNLPPSNVIAFYLPDYATESGAPDTSPAMAALSAAGVLFNTAAFVEQFFARGAIKASVLSVDGGTAAETERLQHWWDDVVRGIKNAWAAVVVRAKVTAPIVVGDGIEGLQNSELTTEQRQDIATALGVPESRMWSSAANYATRKEDELAYFRGTIIPENNLIGDCLNEQLFIKEHKLEGFSIQFMADELEVFQENEADRANSLGILSNVMPVLVATDILGYSLTDQQKREIAAFQLEKMRLSKPATVMFQPPVQETSTGTIPQIMPIDDQAIRSALHHWKNAYTAAMKSGKTDGFYFDNPDIPDTWAQEIALRLQTCQTDDEVKSVFAQANEWRIHAKAAEGY